MVSFPRVVKVADVVSILRSNKHNGFPVSLASSAPSFAHVDMFWPISQVFYHNSSDPGDRSHKKWGNTRHWTYASQVCYREFVFFLYAWRRFIKVVEACILL